MKNTNNVIVFGATGYTGRLVVQELINRKLYPVLAGRNREKLCELGKQYGGLEVKLADANDFVSCKNLLHPGDVLISTVGPFCRFGHNPLAAAVEQGAHYLDSTGESLFIKHVFQRWSDTARQNGSLLLPAFGHDWVPGNIAGAFALRCAPTAVKLDIGYFLTGRSSLNSMSSGTRASAADVFLNPTFTWENNRLVQCQPAATMKRFTRPRSHASRLAFSIGGTEQFALPYVFSQLESVNVYLGWFGPLTSLVVRLSHFTSRPRTRRWLESLLHLGVSSSGQGPSPVERQKTGSLVIAHAYDQFDSSAAQVVLHGGNGYDITARCLAWGANAICEQRFLTTGASGPVEAFGLDQLLRSSEELGLQYPKAES